MDVAQCLFVLSRMVDATLGVAERHARSMASFLIIPSVLIDAVVGRTQE